MICVNKSPLPKPRLNAYEAPSENPPMAIWEVSILYLSKQATKPGR
jgi:hypothetical protein